MTTRVDQLTAATSIASTDLILVEQGGVLKQGTPALLPFSPAGTGAVERAAQTKLREEMISVKDFGALGDGVTNDRAAISSAVTAANGRKLMFPVGTYLISSAFAFSDSDRPYFEGGATLSGTAPTGGLREYDLADATPTAGSVMKIEKLFENSSVKLRGRASLWSGNVGTMFGLSREFISTDGAASSPSATLTVQAVNTASPADVVSILAIAMAKGAGCSVYGANLVVTNAAGSSAPKMVGMEIDIEPSVGVTPAAGSGGLFFNVFNSACSGAAIQMNGVSSGTWGNGISISGIAAAGSGLFSNGASMDSLINTGSSTYAGAAIILTNTHKLRLAGTSSTHGYVYMDSSNNIRHVLGSGSLLVRESTDATTIATISSAGKLTLGATLDISSAAGGQVAFPASQNASSDANTLDDYEEGTWTPVLTFGTPGDLAVTYSVQVATYTKVGRLVTVSWGITTSAFTWTTSSGNLQITGLPFTSLTLTNAAWFAAMRWSGITKATYTQITARVNQNASFIVFNASGSAAAVANVVAADLPSTGTVALSGTLTYETA